MILLTCLLCSAATSADIMCLWEVPDNFVVNDSDNKNVLEILHGAFYEMISWEVAHRIKLMDGYKSQYEEMMTSIIQNSKDTEVMYKVVRNYVVNSLKKLGYKNLDVDKNRPNIMSGLATMSTKMNKKEVNLDDQRRSTVLFGKFEIENHHLIYIKYMVDCLFLTMAIESYKKDKPAALQYIHKLISDEHNFAREETAVAYSNLVNNSEFKHYFFCFEKVLNDGKKGEHFACWHNGNVSNQSFIIYLKNYTALYKRMFDTYCFKQNTLGQEKNLTAESLLIDKLNYVLDSQEQIEKIMKMKTRIKYRFFTEIYILSTSGYGFNLVKSMSRENQGDRNLEDEVQILNHFWNFDMIYDSILIDIFAPRLRETII